jgi:hypothetical protein
MENIGIDVHKRDSPVCILGEGGEVVAEVAPLLSLMLQLNKQIAFLDGMLERVARQDEELARLCTALLSDNYTSPSTTTAPPHPE